MSLRISSLALDYEVALEALKLEVYQQRLNYFAGRYRNPKQMMLLTDQPKRKTRKFLTVTSLNF